MKKIVFICLLLLNMKLSSQNQPIDLIKGKTWQIISIDSGGTTINFPQEQKYLVESIDFSTKKCVRCKLFDKKNRKIYQKIGFKGLLISTGEEKRESKYYCKITAYYKFEADHQVKLIYFDFFKFQNQLDLINDKMNSWLLLLLSSESTIEEPGENTINIIAKKYTKGSRPINIKLKLQKVE